MCGKGFHVSTTRFLRYRARPPNKYRYGQLLEQIQSLLKPLGIGLNHRAQPGRPFLRYCSSSHSYRLSSLQMFLLRRWAILVHMALRQKLTSNCRPRFWAFSRNKAFTSSMGKNLELGASQRTVVAMVKVRVKTDHEERRSFGVTISTRASQQIS